MNTMIGRIMMKTILLLVVGLTSINSISAQIKADEIIGIWELEDKTSKMEIYKQNARYFGKLLYGKDVVNEDGTSKKDTENPDPKLRKQDLIGSTYIKDLAFDGKEYDDGKVYDSSTGKTWKCFVSIKGGDLHFTGYMGVKWLGQTYVYKRLK
ncbi:MAG: DUF2147 domain-containing protein [Carboxylicivirga sp.]|jgi:uncharacterized protein (DUF2147 family)|nr:DUF2147 domain-containing protein [Carboxylicivirga sp.]